MHFNSVAGLLTLATVGAANTLNAADFPGACSAQCNDAVSLSSTCAEQTSSDAEERQCICGAGARNELMYCAACSISNGQNDPDSSMFISPRV